MDEEMDEETLQALALSMQEVKPLLAVRSRALLR